MINKNICKTRTMKTSSLINSFSGLSIKPDIIHSQSQKSGFIFENLIRTLVFSLNDEINNTGKYDIPCILNKYDKNENVSIKSTGSKNIDCADIIRFYNYDMSKKNTIIVICYIQLLEEKHITELLEIDYSDKLHKLLFGTIPLEKLLEYVEYIKSIPNGKIDSDKRKEYLSIKNNLCKEFNMNINICPKVDSKNQRRVQCSIPKFKTLLKDFIINKSPNTIRDIEIPISIHSPRRVLKA